jgi:hypothetical protein
MRQPVDHGGIDFARNTADGFEKLRDMFGHGGQ